MCSKKTPEASTSPSSEQPQPSSSSVHVHDEGTQKWYRRVLVKKMKSGPIRCFDFAALQQNDSHSEWEEMEREFERRRKERPPSPNPTPPPRSSPPAALFSSQPYDPYNGMSRMEALGIAVRQALKREKENEEIAAVEDDTEEESAHHRRKWKFEWEGSTDEEDSEAEYYSNYVTDDSDGECSEGGPPLKK